MIRRAREVNRARRLGAIPSPNLIESASPEVCQSDDIKDAITAFIFNPHVLRRAGPIETRTECCARRREIKPVEYLHPDQNVTLSFDAETISLINCLLRMGVTADVIIKSLVMSLWGASLAFTAQNHLPSEKLH